MSSRALASCHVHFFGRHLISKVAPSLLIPFALLACTEDSEAPTDSTPGLAEGGAGGEDSGGSDNQGGESSGSAGDGGSEPGGSEPSEPNGGGGSGPSEPNGEGGAQTTGGNSGEGGGGDGEAGSSTTGGTSGEAGAGQAGAGTGEGGSGQAGASSGEGGSGQAGAASDPYALGRDEELVVPGEAYLSCETDEDCTLVGTSCAACCDLTSIDASLVDTYTDAFQDACMDYEGPVCDCIPLPSRAVCIDQACATLLVEEGDEQTLCEDSGGTWDTGSCGHYECGNPPDCRALIPGCDCGPEGVFDASTGCVTSASCGSPEAEMLCEDSGGTWEPSSCGHYVCGEPPSCLAIIPGCNCGDGQNFVEDEGCQSAECQ